MKQLGMLLLPPPPLLSIPYFVKFANCSVFKALACTHADLNELTGACKLQLGSSVQVSHRWLFRFQYFDYTFFYFLKEKTEITLHNEALTGSTTSKCLKAKYSLKVKYTIVFPQSVIM